MPRSNWKGIISFGLVTIPIVLFNAENPASTISFKQIDRKTGNRIKYKRIDVETEKEVPWEQIGKGYEYSKDVILPIEEGELKKVAGENARTIAIEEFVDKKSITAIDIDKTYYLVPDKKGEKGYVILREALSRSGKVGIAKVIISTREYLACVAPYENALVLYLLHYAEELRELSEFNIPSEDIKKYKVNTKEIEIAKKLIDSMSAKWKPEKYKDEYKLAVEKWIKAKVNKHPEARMMQRGAHKQAHKVVNFVDLLKRSLNKPAKKASNKKVTVVKKTASHRKEARH